MKTRPILFNGEMVRAILAGKTQTRRVIKPQFGNLFGQGMRLGDTAYSCHVNIPDGDGWKWLYCPYGQPGDWLWVRETHHVDWYPDGVLDSHGRPGTVHYRADLDAISQNWKGHWRPSIFMFRWASRLLLNVTSIRVERVQDISEDDVEAEGVDYIPSAPAALDHRTAFAGLWNSINARHGRTKVWKDPEYTYWLWGHDESDDPESVCLDVAEPGDIQWKSPNDPDDSSWHRFATMAPPCDGYYLVKWQSFDLPEFVYLSRDVGVEN